MTSVDCIENELIRLHTELADGEIDTDTWQEQTSQLYEVLKYISVIEIELE